MFSASCGIFRKKKMEEKKQISIIVKQGQEGHVYTWERSY